MSTQRVDITSPVGRIVMGNLYSPRTTDFDGNPLLIKNGPNKGQPRVDYFIALAIPKAGETHWATTEWGKQIWTVGHTAFPQAAQRPDFAWKIDDGDSTVPNKKNRRPCDNEGWPGHWILKLSGGFAPKVYRAGDAGGWVQVLDKDFVKPGYFAQISFNVSSNDQQNNPGVYLNHSMVAFRAFSPLGEINFGPNVEAAGFGSAPLPAGASLTPPAATLPAPSSTLPMFAGPPAPVPASIPPVPLVVAPVPGFVQMPPPPGVGAPSPTAGAIPAPPAPASPFKMTAKAGPVTHEAFLAGGWTDAQLIEQGYMTLG